MSEEQIKIVVRDSDNLIIKIGEHNDPLIEGQTNMMAPPLPEWAAIGKTKYTLEQGYYINKTVCVFEAF